MATANERRPGTQPEFEWKGKSRARRTFLVDLPPRSVPKDGSVPGLPALSESHPTIPGARVDLILPTAINGKDNHSDVEVLYSSDRSFSFPQAPLDPTTIGFNSWTIAFEDVTTEIPVLKRITRTIPQPLGGAPVTQSTWAYGPGIGLSVLETRALFTYRFNLNEFAPNMWTAIHAQINKIHTLSDSNLYRFRAGDIVQTTETAWEASYTWEFDGGTFSPLAVNASPLTAGQLIYPPGLPGGQLIRFAHSQWAVVDAPTPGVLPASFLLVEPFEHIPSGWQTLPGI